MFVHLSAADSTIATVLAGVSGQVLHRLQVIQNAAARLVTGVRKYERMTPVLR